MLQAFPSNTAPSKGNIRTPLSAQRKRQDAQSAMQTARHVSDARVGSEGPGPSTLAHARRILLIQYEARISPRSSAFVWPSHAILLCIEDKIDHDLFQSPRYEATASYRTVFLRELCARLDAAVQAECAALRSQGVDEIEHPEVNAALLERYVEVMTSGSSSSASVTASSAPDMEVTTHYWPGQAGSGDDAGADETDLLRDYHRVTIREEGSAISKGTTGLRTWEAGLRLAGHLISDPSIITSPDTRILELGSGAGFVGTVCATQQAASQHDAGQTFLTDMPGQVVTRLRDTLQVNGLDASSAVTVKELDWLELSAERQQSQQRDDLPTISFLAEAKPTLVLAADVVYDPDLVAPLVETIQASLEAGTRQCRALVASTIRNPETYGLFKSTLASFGLEAIVVELQRPTMTPPDPAWLPDLPALAVFPSAHDPRLNGHVELLSITLG